MAAAAVTSPPNMSLRQPEMTHLKRDPSAQGRDAAHYINLFVSPPLSPTSTRNNSGATAKSADKKPESSPARQSLHYTHSDPRRWSKESDGSQIESVILGRPLSDTSIRPPPPALHNVQSPKSMLSSPVLSSNPVSPRSAGYDPEKGHTLPLSPRTYRSRPHSRSSILEQSCYQCREDEEVDEVYLEDKALAILIYLSGPVILTSFISLLWAVLSLLVSALLTPIRLFKKSPSASTQLTNFLAPVLRLQLTLIHSPKLRALRRASTSHSHTHTHHHNHNRHDSAIAPSPQSSTTSSSSATPSSSSSPSEDEAQLYSLPLLILVHLLSPLVSLGVALAAWTAAVFWFYAAIIGDPSGRDRPEGYNDGKASVLGVRGWWETWLAKALRM